MKILVIHGANLNLLGERDPAKYGKMTLNELEKFISLNFTGITFDFYQNNIEGEIVDRIQRSFSEDFDGLIINPGGYAHTSVVIRDALELVKIPKIEVHLSNLAAREPFRQSLITASVCNGYISGLKQNGYIAAVEVICRMNKENYND